MSHRGYSSIMSSSRRRYETFPGSMQFPCDGRATMAKNTGVFKFTLVLIVVASGLFFGFDLPYLTEHVSPVFPAVASILFIFTLACLVRTALMDPGVLPRATGQEAAFNERGGVSLDQSMSRSGYTAPSRTKVSVIQGQEVTMKYCFTCRMFRPPRTSHCSLCDSCIENFDHHCPWVGNCVGRRNYRYFYLFLVMLTIYCLFIFTSTIYHLVVLAKEPGKSFSAAIGDTPATLIVAIVCFFSIWSVLGLCGFHTALIVQAITTNEDIKGTYNRSRHGNVENPFDHGGYIQNMKYTLCAPVPKSLLGRRELINADEVAAEEETNRMLPGPTARAAQAIMQSSQPISVTMTTPSVSIVANEKEEAEENTECENSPLVST